MIVPSMTHAEVYRELEKDRANVERWFDHRDAEFRRKVLKATRFPVTCNLEYTSPRRVQYLFSILAKNRKYIDISVMTLALRRELHGYSVYMTRIGEWSTVRKSVYLPHFFDRYAERVHVSKTGIDLIYHFFNRLTSSPLMEGQRLAAKSVRYNGRDHRFMAMQDGVMLGDVEHGIFIVRTFITYDMAGGLQQEQFEAARNRVHSIDEEINFTRDMQAKNRIRLLNINYTYRK